MMALAALGLCVLAAHCLAVRWSPVGSGRTMRVAAAAVLLPTLVITTARVLGGIGAIALASLLAAFAGIALLAWWTREDRFAPRATAPPAFEAVAALPLAAGAFALSIAGVAAYRLPIWQWDSLGYHLPFVAFALQAGSLAGVPWHLPYIGSYPHAVELWDLVARALLPDDRWLDAAQLPLCLCGAVGIAGLARRAGARAALAAVAGGLWLTLPAVFLQLPSAYVDVASAGLFLLALFWILAPPTFASATLTGLALGLFLGSKPAAPPAALLLGIGFAVRAWRARRPWLPLLSAGLALALGSEAYFTNMMTHANPLWPIQLDLGPWHAPGLVTPAQVLESGAAAPHLGGPLLSRVLRSWVALDPLPAFDMRVGGFGPVFLFLALPLGLVGAVRRKGLWLLGLAAALATPDPAVARFTLPFPAILLALSCGELERLGPRLRSGLLAIAAGLAGVGLWLSLPGLAAGHPLWEALGWDQLEQESELLPPETAHRWATLRAGLRPGSAVAVDRAFDLLYLLWRSDMANRVDVLPPGLEGQALADWLRSRRIAFLVGGRMKAGGRLARMNPRLLTALFPCGASEPECEVYEVNPDLSSGPRN